VVSQHRGQLLFVFRAQQTRKPATYKAVESRDSYGGTAPERVRQAAAAARERFL